jgi:hypothetical protein
MNGKKRTANFSLQVAQKQKKETSRHPSHADIHILTPLLLLCTPPGSSHHPGSFMLAPVDIHHRGDKGERGGEKGERGDKGDRVGFWRDGSGWFARVALLGEPWRMVLLWPHWVGDISREREGCDERCRRPSTPPPPPPPRTRAKSDGAPMLFSSSLSSKPAAPRWDRALPPALRALRALRAEWGADDSC